MQTPPSDLKRKIVPRWRSIARTPVPELENYRTSPPVDTLVLTELKQRVAEWDDERTAEAAKELLWATAVFGQNTITERPVNELAAAGDLSEDVRQSAAEFIVERPSGTIGLGFQLDTRATLRSRIKTLKREIAQSPRNPIQLVELARLYSRIGQVEQAKKTLFIACALAPTSRFVVRAATRFFVHVQDYARAISILDKANQSDPWVQASRVSIYDLSGRAIRDIRRARSVLEIDAHPRHLSELAGSLATLEFGSGSVSRARKLFKRGATDPNDNVVAQLQWAAQNKILEFRPELLERSLTFEARAAFARKEKKWKEVLLHCADWINDEPLSPRPATLGSYIASALLQDYHKSVEFCELGLVANPEDFTLLNNLAFSCGALGDLQSATKYLDKALLCVKTKADEVTALATKGMIAFREGRTESGTELYNRAVELARENKLYGLAQLAVVHYFCEVAGIGNFLSAQEAQAISNLMNNKRIVEEARDVYDARLAPTLLSQKVEESAQNRIGNILPNIVES